MKTNCWSVGAVGLHLYVVSGVDGEACDIGCGSGFEFFGSRFGSGHPVSDGIAGDGGCWLVGVCHVALIEVDDRGVREG